MPDLAKAHGTVMGVTFVIVFPLGAVLMRVAKFKGAVWVHAAVQLLGWALMIAGLGLGVRLGKIVDYVSPACLFWLMGSFQASQTDHAAAP